MSSAPLVPAAQYLRMSTEGQQYSLLNQADAIQAFARANSLEVVKTYSDSGRSGLRLDHREGLKQLLTDVVAGEQLFKAILVYDVSRWGRFQDTDEAAHYEFLCKQAGIPVCYCAETFSNDGTMPNAIMKALKRAMAGEYSRELSVKCYAGQRRIAAMGFNVGGIAAFGLRRMVVSAEGTPKRVLADGEAKSIKTDRIILVPGPRDEVATVRHIFDLSARLGLTTAAIQRRLTAEGRLIKGKAWSYEAVRLILQNPKYAGHATWGRTKRYLGGKEVKRPKSEWVQKRGAFEARVEDSTFNNAERAKRVMTLNRSNDEVLASLRALFKRTGRLTQEIIDANENRIGSPATIRARFGSMANAYRLVGYVREDNYDQRTVARHRNQKLRNEIVARIVGLFGSDVRIIRKNKLTRPLIRLSSGTKIAVVICPYEATILGKPRWVLHHVQRERKLPTLLCRCTPLNDSIKDYHLLTSLADANPSGSDELHLLDNDQRLLSGEKFAHLEEFHRIAELLDRSYRKQKQAARKPVKP
jgi:DNA invertase Pin-like site-specific DNA recombinase